MSHPNKLPSKRFTSVCCRSNRQPVSTTKWTFCHNWSMSPLSDSTLFIHLERRDSWSWSIWREGSCSMRSAKENFTGKAMLGDWCTKSHLRCIICTKDRWFTGISNLKTSFCLTVQLILRWSWWILDSRPSRPKPRDNRARSWWGHLDTLLPKFWKNVVIRPNVTFGPLALFSTSSSPGSCHSPRNLPKNIASWWANSLSITQLLPYCLFSVAGWLLFPRFPISIYQWRGEGFNQENASG